MYVIVEINGQQFKAEEGKKLFVHHIQNAENGATVEFDKVLLVDNNGTVTVGAPTVEGAKVVCEVVSPLVKGDKVLVLYLPDCHESIAGIIAGRIKDRLNHPVFVLTDAKDGIKGSGRSIEEYSMFEEMMKVKEVFTKFGGHPMAAGCSLEKENLKAFRKKINENCTLDEKDFAKKVQIDIDMPVDYITMDLIHQLSVLEPFGKENKKPLFAHRKLKIERVNVFGKNKNVIKLALKSSQGTRIDGMIFEDEDEFREKMGTAKYITCTYYPVINEYQGYKSLQINIQNYFFVEE